MPRCDARVTENICKECKSPVIVIANNTGLLGELGEWDWIVYCANKGCVNHQGTGVFQDDPDWYL